MSQVGPMFLASWTTRIVHFGGCSYTSLHFHFLNYRAKHTMLANESPTLHAQVLLVFHSKDLHALPAPQRGPLPPPWCPLCFQTQPHCLGVACVPRLGAPEAGWCKSTLPSSTQPRAQPRVGPWWRKVSCEWVGWLSSPIPELSPGDLTEQDAASAWASPPLTPTSGKDQSGLGWPCLLVALAS